MSKDTVNVEVSEGLVRPIIEAKIQAAIVESLGSDPTALIEAIVKQALNVKVDEKGNINSSSYSNRYTYLEAIVGKVIRDETKRALEELMELNRPKIKNEIKKQLARDNKASKLASAIIDGMTESLKCKYSNRIEVKFDTPSES